MTRRDKCYSIGKRMSKLDIFKSAKAWESLAFMIEMQGEKDIPKFKDLLTAIRLALEQGEK